MSRCREISRSPESADAMMGLPWRRSQIRKRLTCSARRGMSSDESERPISQRSTRFHFSEKAGSFVKFLREKLVFFPVHVEMQPFCLLENKSQGNNTETHTGAISKKRIPCSELHTLTQRQELQKKKCDYLCGSMDS